MTSFQGIYERILCATNVRTQTELADLLEIRQSSISDAKRRNSIPSDWYMKLFEKYHLNPEWLKRGTGPMFLNTDTTIAPTIHETPMSSYGEPMTHPIITSLYSMIFDYTGGTPHRPPVIGKIVLPASRVTENIAVLSVESDSAAPTVRKGAQIGVDTAATLPISGQLFTVYTPHEGLTIKRLFNASERSGFILRSDAPNHPESFLSSDDCKARIFGQIVWVLQDL